jgi:D-alanyl-D-alanine carboxypeptidase
MPMRSDHLLKIASNTKSFVAAVVLQLAQEGLIDLNATLDRWFPDLPNSKFITLRQVMGHQSGIPDRDYDSLDPKPSSDSYWKPQDIVELAYSTNPICYPGNYTYSNTNYVLLGMLIEKETGESRAEQVQKRLLNPLGLKDTYTATEEDYPQSRLARGYSHDKGEPVDVTHLYPMSFAGPSGDMISTAGDLVKWLEAIFNGDVVEEPYLKEFVTAQVEGTYPGTAMSAHALGTMIFSYNDLEVVGYRGALQGYISIMAHEREHSISAVILTNSYQSNRLSYHVAGLDRPLESVFRTILAVVR